MAKFMKMLNNISRSQAVYRKQSLPDSDLCAAHHAFVFAICREPGRTQDEIAKELCINKSTAARNLNALEENGYIERVPSPSDKRCLFVYPTDKMLSVLPKVQDVARDWMSALSEGISEEELEIFNSVLSRMQDRAKAIAFGEERGR